MITDKLIDKIIETQSPCVAGIDTSFDYLPEERKKGVSSLRGAAEAVLEFNYELLDSLSGVVPAVKVQVAYYEMYGAEGMRVFADTLAYAEKKGFITIADVKRNDIGSTAECYAKAYLSGVKIGGNEFTPFNSHYITVNGYLGQDGIKPFTGACQSCEKGIFVLAKTSNPTSGQLQDRRLDSGETVYEAMGKLISEWNSGTIGKHGYGAVGAVVGATHVRQAESLRTAMPGVLFLVPGYGAQGGTADDVAVCFGEDLKGALVNSSRGILLAYRNEKYCGLKPGKAAAAAAEDMGADIRAALKRAGKL